MPISLTHYEQEIRDIFAKHFIKMGFEQESACFYPIFADDKAFDEDIYKLLNDLLAERDLEADTYIHKLLGELFADADKETEQKLKKCFSKVNAIIRKGK